MRPTVKVVNTSLDEKAAPSDHLMLGRSFTEKTLPLSELDSANQ